MAESRSWPALDIGALRWTSVESDDIGELDRLQAALVEFDVAAIDETAADRWRIYFHQNGERDRAADVIQHAFPHFTLTPLSVADENWAARSQAALRAIRVGNITVAPPWDVPDPASRDIHSGGTSSELPITIVIQPSMGFGTGHHATTRLCLLALQQIDLRGHRVLDVGTGSGVLAIAARRLGARHVTGLDDDRDAIDAARDNLAREPLSNVELQVGDIRSLTATPYDVVVANLTGGLLIQAASALTSATTSTGQLVLSGFMRHEESDVLAAFSRFRVRDRLQEDEWMCVTLQQEGAFV